MKTLIIVMAFALIVIPQAMATDLVTDPMAGVSLYDVDHNGTIIEDIAAESDGSLKFNVDSLPAGNHTFRVKPIGQGGWPADWSAPFDATKPQTASGIRIVP